MKRKTYFLNELGQQQTIFNTYFYLLKFISDSLNLCESIYFVVCQRTSEEGKYEGITICRGPYLSTTFLYVEEYNYNSNQSGVVSGQNCNFN